MNDIVTDVPPTSLFKYRGFDKSRLDAVAFERDRSIILNSLLWAGSPLTFNDPFDCFPVIDFEGSEDEKVAWAARVAPQFGQSIEQAVAELNFALGNPTIRTQLSNWRENLSAVRVLSLTDRPDDMLMWAHYADSHRGYCLEFDSNVLPFSLAYRVKYDAERPTFRIFDPNREDLIKRTLLHKADFWQYEGEWRLIGPAEIGPISFPQEALKSVILGAGTLHEDELELRRIASERRIPVIFKRAVLDDRAYRLLIVDT